MMLSRRSVLGAGAGWLPLHGIAAGQVRRPGLQRGWLGTYTYAPGEGPADLGRHAQSRGLYGFDFDPVSGRISDPWLAAERPSPTNLILHPVNNTVYACRGGDFVPGGEADIAALRVDGRQLRELNRLGAGGTGPTHGAVDRRGRFLVTTDFSSDEVVVFRLARDGSLVERTARLSPGAGGLTPPPPPGSTLPPQSPVCRTSARAAVDGCRTKPHIALFSPAERFVLVAEIANDAVAIYRFDHAAGTLALHDIAQGLEGSGPRHLAWSRDGRFFYSSDEHGSQVSAWSWDEVRGAARRIQSLRTVPAGFTGRNTTAHIAVHPSGRALWVSNRGHPSLAGFRINPRTGLLTASARTQTGSRDCWCFDFDLTGRWLLAALMTTDTIAVFSVNADAATLVPGARVSAPFPTCLRMAP